MTFQALFESDFQGLGFLPSFPGAPGTFIYRIYESEWSPGFTSAQPLTKLINGIGLLVATLAPELWA